MDRLVEKPYQSTAFSAFSVENLVETVEKPVIFAIKPRGACPHFPQLRLWKTPFAVGKWD